MELSSPLAAMRPQAVPTWGQRDLPSGGRSMYGYQRYGPNSFNFRDISMNQHTQRHKPGSKDYFTVRPVRGSSPTASLTADLGANFHIDKSPQVATPRRSLFTTDLFRPRDHAGRLATPPTDIEGATSPDIPSSSPAPGDMMDISPLPHKAPYFQVTLPSPSPEQTPDDADISPDFLSLQEASTPLQALTSQSSESLALPERRRPVTRPSLTRSKGFSTNNIPQRSTTGESSLPPFWFGNVTTSGLASSSTPSLLESFTESPVDGVPPSGAAASMLPPPRRPSLLGNGCRNTGSPVSNHVRKPSAGRPAFVRPQRKIMRRSLSMFQHPNDVMKEEQDIFQSSDLASVMDVDQQDHELMLPNFVSSEEPDGLPRISQETMIDVLENKHADKYDSIKVIDCRFEYEYEGGHIENAVNFNDKQQLAAELFGVHQPPSTLLIFHCEYSVHRAPLTAKYIRGHDRTVNAANYPKLTYPEMYILDGGYSTFFKSHRTKCSPQNYVEMNDEKHEQACERGLAKVKGRQKLFRAQTFAFGQNAQDEMEDSPTAQGRSMGPRSQSSFHVGNDLAEGIGNSYARRMASY
ncbi:putative cdc25-like protein tyrosine phosphatase [Teratosphaeria nubilosa]|uniref:M-phase inducer phosphatase n=1 Tax=Teratosphaeria nubilosa TaxID=161662 RepID=A0A6G1LJD5_9PEZI|nr:putative cdc25-like protein tyrosine phosphatase [Teratosphaeria nubilosa]